MQFSKVQYLAILATFFSTITAAPTSPVTQTLSKRDNYCGDSTFNGLGYPWAYVSDCQQLAANIVGDGSWVIPGTNHWHGIASYGTCGFFARSGHANVAISNIGNEDLRDLIRDSINKFQGNGVVGAQGGMPCKSGFGDIGVQWQITNSVGAQ